MNSFPKKKSIQNRSVLSFGLLVAAATIGCQAVDYGTTVNSQSQTTCAQSLRAFNSGGSENPNLSTDQLPAGIYAHKSSEVYVSDGRSDRATYSQVQYFTAPPANGEIAGSTVALRCQESKSSFIPFSSSATLVTSLTRLNNTTISTSSRTYGLVFSAAKSSSLAISGGGSTQAASSMDVSYSLLNYWTGGYRFTHRSGDTYEFYGIRYESSTRIIYGKAVYLRTNLPVGSP
ncbi:MAG: hypothetical protein H7301_03280 [Cryobacterium sp.]|nr:hypothetical protein [Oligoflexia bacterium]